VSSSLASVVHGVIGRIKRLFDLNANPAQITNALGDIAVANPGLRLPGTVNGFETAMRAILGQQVSVAAARTLAGRVAKALGTPIETPQSALTILMPNASTISHAGPEALSALGVVPSRACAIVTLASAVASGRLDLDSHHVLPETVAALSALPGIGEWTAQYIAMRAFNWPDAFPHTDLGIRRALGESNPKRVLEAAEKWRPWRAYAAMHLWKSLEESK
jgi:AraC family transcriptional regulator of adaptative response / DNA-3-methyladenine glycosylase II